MAVDFRKIKGMKSLMEELGELVTIEIEAVTCDFSFYYDTKGRQWIIMETKKVSGKVRRWENATFHSKFNVAFQMLINRIKETKEL